MSAMHLLLLAALLACGIQGALWLLYRRTDRADWVDAGWAGSLGLMAILYGVAGTGALPRRLLVAGLGGAWGLRLAFHLARRIMNGPEDGRYTQLKAEWVTGLPGKFFLFFQCQALLAVFLALPFLWPSLDARPGIGLVTWMGAALAGVAIGGEALADAQLRSFKADPSNRGEVCRAGLWSLSRHPNYFFEWLIWVAFTLLAWASPWGWTAILCPALMLYFLLRVTGIPATEAQSLRSRGEAYARYQREVSAFLPWLPKRGSE
jgi:steroid 5-alpha reductase family enzyme